MNPEAVNILTQISEQKRKKIETSLTELNNIKSEQVARLKDATLLTKHLNRQRDLSTSSHIDIGELSLLDAVIMEQQAVCAQIRQQLEKIEARREHLLREWRKNYQKKRQFEFLIKKQVQCTQRRDELREQRQSDDLCSARRLKTPQ